MKKAMERIKRKLTRGSRARANVRAASAEQHKLGSTAEQPVYSLDELIAGINDGNLHGEFKTGHALGHECV